MLAQPRVDAAIRALTRLESTTITYQRIGRNGFVLFGVAKTDSGTATENLKAVNVTASVCLALSLPFDEQHWTTNAFHPSGQHAAILRELTGITFEFVGT